MEQLLKQQADALFGLESRLEAKLGAQLMGMREAMAAMRNEVAELHNRLGEVSSDLAASASAPSQGGPRRRPSGSAGCSSVASADASSPQPLVRQKSSSPWGSVGDVALVACGSTAGGSCTAGGSSAAAASRSPSPGLQRSSSSLEPRKSEAGGSSAKWHLVEADDEMRSMLKAVRSQIDTYAERADREIEHSLNVAAAALKPADEAAVGTLHVRLARATGLKSADLNGFSDPYVKLTFNGVTQKSRIIKKTLDPEFNETFAFDGVLGELIRSPLLLHAFDHDVVSNDDSLGQAEVNLYGQYYAGKEHEHDARLDTQGSLKLQVWWFGEDLERPANEMGDALSAHEKPGWCKRLCVGPIIHPDSRFRSGWNVALAFFICYCGIAVPLEIAFETDMVDSMCGTGDNLKLRGDCDDFQAWFWGNFVVDIFFIIDVSSQPAPLAAAC